MSTRSSSSLQVDLLPPRADSSAGPLLEAWLIDQFLCGHLSAEEAARLGGISPEHFGEWLRKRRLLHLMHQPTSTGRMNGEEIRPEFSVVLPIYNEEQNLPELHKRLSEVLSSLGDYELVFVNDGSSDGSSEVIRCFRETDPHVKLIEFSRNFGHQAAVTAGMDLSRGQAVMLMDADLQDPPELLAAMVEKWREGFEVVYAVRKRRKESIAKRSAYFLFYRLLHTLADIDIPLDSGDFCLMDRAVVEQLKQLPERNRFLRGLRSWVGFRQFALPYDRQARHLGAPKYTMSKLIRLAADGIVSFSSSPLRFAAYLGLLTSLAGVCYLVFALFAKLTNGAVPVGWTTIVALVLLMGGAQLVLLGVMGEYIARIYDEAKRRPNYIISRYLG